MRFSVRRTGGGSIDLDLVPGRPLVVVGANGAGKSRLLHSIQKQGGSSCWIPAHRQSWFESSNIQLVPASRQEMSESLRRNEGRDSSVYEDRSANSRIVLLFYDLLDSENRRNRKLANLIDKGEVTTAVEFSFDKSITSKINGILARIGLNIKVNISDGKYLEAVHSNGSTYRAEKMSDGERSCLYILAKVLSASNASVVIIDEPERHIHPSISIPLINELMLYKRDATFVIATHDIILAENVNGSQLLALYGGEFDDSNLMKWDAEYFSTIDQLSEDVRDAVLGSRINTIFIEGSATSIDLFIYRMVFTNANIVYRGSSKMVVGSVKAMRDLNGAHRWNVFGIVDGDGTEMNSEPSLNSDGVLHLGVYSIESILFNIGIVMHVLKMQQNYYSDTKFVQELELRTTLVDTIAKHREHLVQRIHARVIRNSVMMNLVEIESTVKGQSFVLEIQFEELWEKELKYFDQCIARKDLETLISRYPIRETGFVNELLNALNMTHIDDYKSVVRTLYVSTPQIKKIVDGYLQQLVDLVNVKD